MSRSLSEAAVTSAFAQQTSKVWATLLTLARSGVWTLRYTDNTEDLNDGSNNFTAFPFAIALANMGEDRPPECTLMIGNVDGAVMERVGTVTAPVDAEVKIVLADAPTVGLLTQSYELRKFDANESIIQATLTTSPVYDEQIPQHSFSPGWYPAIFRPVAAPLSRAGGDITVGRGGPAYTYAGARRRD